jgi:hypothetical protein
MYFFDGFEQNFFEFGIYLVIVILAATLVFSVIWKLNKRLNVSSGKASAKSEGKGKLIGSKEAPLMLESGKSHKNEKHGKEPKNQHDKHGKDEKGSSGKKDHADKKHEKEEHSNKKSHEPEAELNLPVNEEETQQKEVPEEYKQAMPEQIVSTPEGDIALPSLPAADVLEESDEEYEEKMDTEDLLNIFQSEDEDESNLTDMASNMFEVDLKGLGDLGVEVLQYMGVDSAKNVKEDLANEEENEVTEEDILFGEEGESGSADEAEAVYETELNS